MRVRFCPLANSHISPPPPTKPIRQVYAYHIYCPLNSTGQPNNKLLCTFLEDELVHMRAQELQRLGVGVVCCTRASSPPPPPPSPLVFSLWRSAMRVPLACALAVPFVGQTAGFMTEFGAYEDGFGDDLTDARRLLGLADDMLQSWQYWMVGWQASRADHLSHVLQQGVLARLNCGPDAPHLAYVVGIVVPVVCVGCRSRATVTPPPQPWTSMATRSRGACSVLAVPWCPSWYPPREP